MKKKTFIIIWAILAVVLLVAAIAVQPDIVHHESIKEMMKDAVLHESNKINLLGLIDVNPALISGFTVTGVLLVFALIVRIFVIPKFKIVPGKLQMLLEEAVGMFTNMAKQNCPHKYKLLGGYIFCAAAYIFIGTLFELFGLQAVTTTGVSIALPAPLADINAAIAMGVTSYLFILMGGIANNGIHGLLGGLKEFSLPISMSFRLFGALLSGLLVTELVYYTLSLSIVLPVAVGVMFTLLHALIQTYVLTTLTALFYGEVSEKSQKKPKKLKKVKNNA